ncbi:MAG: TGS domain-containing protein, partial [Candidatus Altiarchaeota archaeon]|nr:TGS domain-containing protein [Candidatus Altiarchaeota archaeon]
YDPENDIKFLEEEIDLWFYGILKKNWKKIYNKAKHNHKDLIIELAEQLSGLEVNEEQVGEAAKKSDLTESTNWSDEQLQEFATNLREISKPIIIVANKIDLDHGNFDRLKENYDLVPVCSEAELALRQAEKAGVVSYLPGDKEFKILKDVDEKQKKALEFIQNNILKKYGSTGVQNCLNTAVFDILKQIVVYPVENENKFMDNKGNVLPDAHLLPEGSTALDLAYKVHTDIGDKFIGAIDCKTKMKVRKDHQLNDCDVIKIITGR